MTTGPQLPERPQLRPIEVSRISHEGSDFFVLKDPRHFDDKSLLVPVSLAPYLRNFDGTNTVEEIIETALNTGAPPVQREILGDLIARLDEVFLLANGAYSAEKQRRLDEYRDAPARKAAFADLSYPGSPDDLRAYLDGLAFPYMSGPVGSGPNSGSGSGSGSGESGTGDSGSGTFSAASDNYPSGILKAVLSPHIDFERGGDSYAMIWEQVRSELQDVELFVVFGTDHNGDGPRLTLTNQNYESPIGGLDTDSELVDQLAEILATDDSIENHPFADEFNHAGEHSIELVSVWLHRALGNTSAKMLPVLCGSFGRLVPEPEAGQVPDSEQKPENKGEADLDVHPQISAFIRHLQEIATQRRTVFIAAADLSHVGPAFGDSEERLAPLDSVIREQVRLRDEQLLAAIVRGDRKRFFEIIKADSDSNKVCGVAPIYMTLWAAEAQTGIWNGYQQCQADESNTSFVSIAGAALYG